MVTGFLLLVLSDVIVVISSLISLEVNRASYVTDLVNKFLYLPLVLHSRVLLDCECTQCIGFATAETKGSPPFRNELYQYGHASDLQPVKYAQ
jgi:hypothetical protein